MMAGRVRRRLRERRVHVCLSATGGWVSDVKVAAYVTAAPTAGNEPCGRPRLSRQDADSRPPAHTARR